MFDHISTRQMNEFCARTLDVTEMTKMAEHLAACASCRRLFHEVFDQRRNYAPVVINLSQGWLKHEHMEYEQLVPYVEDRLEGEEREMADIHLQMCERCREDLSSFREFRQQIEPEMSVRYSPDKQSTLRNKILTRWGFTEINRKLIYAAAILFIISGAAALTAILLNSGKTINQQAAKQLPPSPLAGTDSVSSSNTSEPPQQRESGQKIARAIPRASDGELSNREAANINPSKPKTPQRRATRENAKTDEAGRPAEALISLNDRSGRVTLDKAGNVTGLEDIPPGTRQAVREVLLGSDLQRPQVLAELTGEGGTLRGAGDTKAAFSLLSPERTVVAEVSPIFKWQPLKGATSYQVHVVDTGNHEVAKSPELPATAAQWTPSIPLKRGGVYTWIVTARVNGEEITSPAASAPEWKFKVLEEEKMNELNRVKRSNSHLALGIFYARAGMIKDAVREFQLLTDENPHSPVVTKLLRSIQSWR